MLYRRVFSQRKSGERFSHIACSSCHRRLVDDSPTPPSTRTHRDSLEYTNFREHLLVARKAATDAVVALFRQSTQEFEDKDELEAEVDDKKTEQSGDKLQTI